MINLVLCASGADEVELVSLISANLGDQIKISRRCVDIAELLAATSTGLADVAVVDVDTPGFTKEVIRELYARKTAVVALSGDYTNTSFDSLGLNQGIKVNDSIDTIYETLLTAVFLIQEEGIPEFNNELPTQSAELAPLITVWGPHGATGKSFLSMNFAYESALLGLKTLLVDADTYGPCQAQLFGVIDEGPGIIAACRAASKGNLNEGLLKELAPQVAPNLHLLSGIGVASRFRELDGKALSEVLIKARNHFDLVVVDVASNLENNEVYEDLSNTRNAVTITSLQQSSKVISVLKADPVSIARFIRDQSRFREIVNSPVSVVINKVDNVVNAQDIIRSISGRAEFDQVYTVPFQPNLVSKAIWDGTVVAESAARSELRKAISQINHQVIAKEVMANIALKAS